MAPEHSLDFSFWYNRRPLWDIGIFTLMLGGLASSIFGVVAGIRRVRRGAAPLCCVLCDLCVVRRGTESFDSCYEVDGAR